MHTQSFSLSTLKLKVSVTKVCFYQRTVKICASFLGQCPWISAPSATHLTVSLHLCTSESNIRGSFKGQKSLQVFWINKNVAAGRNERELCPIHGGLIDLPSRQTNFIFTKSKQKTI